MTMTMMMVYLTHITGSTVLCVCQHHFELLHTLSTVYHLFSFSMFLQMSLTNMHICFIAFSFVSLLLFGSTLSICLIFSLYGDTPYGDTPIWPRLHRIYIALETESGEMGVPYVPNNM